MLEEDRRVIEKWFHAECSLKSAMLISSFLWTVQKARNTFFPKFWKVEVELVVPATPLKLLTEYEPRVWVMCVKHLSKNTGPLYVG